MKNYAILLIVLIFGALICGCISAPSSSKGTSLATQITTHVPNTGTVTVIVKARAFDPTTITIKEGTTVTWINEDPMLHHVVHLPEVTNAELCDSGPLSLRAEFRLHVYGKRRLNYGDPQIGGGRSSLVIVE